MSRALQRQEGLPLGPLEGASPVALPFRLLAWREVTFSYSDFPPRETTHSFRSPPCPPTLGLAPLSHGSGHQLVGTVGRTRMHHCRGEGPT